MNFDSDKAATRTTRMWFKLGKALEAFSYELAERGSAEEAVRCARLADACFWQATGEAASIMMTDLMRAPQ